MICYHHNDLDGISAAYCVHKYKPSMIEDTPDSYYAFGYDGKFDRHTERDDIFLVDISISESTYEDFLNACRTARTVTWIDHHQTSVDTVNNHLKELQSIKNLTYFVSLEGCGALLTYAYLNFPSNELYKIRKTSDEEIYDISAVNEGNRIKICAYKKSKTNNEWYENTIEIPKWLFHVDDYDRWKKQDKNSNWLELGLQSENTSIAIQDKYTDRRVFNPFWTDLKIDTHMAEYIMNGKIIEKYNNSRYVKEFADTFEWMYNGTKFLCKNTNGNSLAFLNKIEEYDAVIAFHYSGKSSKWKYSVYASDKSSFDCKVFAEQFGGGGHIKASGFSTTMLIFTHPIKESKDVIFLGGTVSDIYDWRSEFTSLWKKTDKKKKFEKIKLFNPVVKDWNEDCIKKENEVKDSAILNLFVITPEMKGPYSFVEALESAYNGKSFLAIYDRNNAFDPAFMKSIDAIGELIEKHGGIYKSYKGDDQMENLVKDVIASL